MRAGLRPRVLGAELVLHVCWEFSPERGCVGIWPRAVGVDAPPPAFRVPSPPFRCELRSGQMRRWGRLVVGRGGAAQRPARLRKVVEGAQPRVTSSSHAEFHAIRHVLSYLFTVSGALGARVAKHAAGATHDVVTAHRILQPLLIGCHINVAA